MVKEFVVVVRRIQNDDKHAMHDKSVQAPQVDLKDPSEKKIHFSSCD